MSDMPERLWANECGDWQDDSDGDNVEYVRADAIPAVQVTVKPLEWQHEARNGWKFGVAWAIGYHVIRRDDGWHYGNGTGGVFPTIEAAKAAAQADYDARIRSALTVTPDPDAAKVAKAVEALRQIADPISLAQGNVNAEIARATLAEIQSG